MHRSLGVDDLVAASRDPWPTGRTIRGFQAKTLGNPPLPLRRPVAPPTLDAATQRLQLVAVHAAPSIGSRRCVVCRHVPKPRTLPSGFATTGVTTSPSWSVGEDWAHEFRQWERAILVRIIQAVDGFWRLVHTEGTDWICDPAVKRLTMTKMAAAVSQPSKRTV